MYFAMLKHPKYYSGERKQYLIVCFQYLNERNTFVKHTSFEELPSAKRYSLGKKWLMERCMNNERMVFNEVGKQVVYINNLYKDLPEQQPKQVKKDVVLFTPKMKSKYIVKDKHRHHTT